MRNDGYNQDHRLPPGMTKLCDRLLNWLSEGPHKNKVVKIILTWLSNYYQDFEVDSNYSHSFFLNLERRLKTQSMEDQLNLLHFTLSAKSRTRQITISRSSREEHLPFTISGGYDKNCGIFVSQVFGYPNNPHDTITRSGSSFSNPSITTSLSMVAIEDRHRNNNIDRSHILKPGDQILEVNNINFRIIKLADAQKILNDATHLSLTIKYNPSEYNEMLNLPEGRRKSSLSSISMSTLVTPSQLISQNIKNRKFSTSDSCKANLDDAFYPPSPLHSSSSAFSFDTALKSSQNKAIKQSINLKSIIIASSKSIINQLRDSNSSNTNMDRISKASQDSISNADSASQSSKAKSNPDLTRTKSNSTPDPDSFKSRLLSNSNSMISTANHQVNVLRVFNAATNDSKYLLIHEETTAREVVMIAVKEFNLANNQNQNNSNGDRTSSLDWALFEVSVVPEAKTIKQRRLPEQMSNLASRAPLRSRFYIKNNNQSSNYNAPSRLEESGDSLFNEITKDCPEDSNIINLDPSLFAKELTLIDFAKFRRIEPQQFVYDTFFDSPSLNKPNKHQGSSNNRNGVSTNNLDNASISSSTDSSNNEHTEKSTPVIPPDWMTEYTDFANISNKVMFWVVNEILRETKRDNRVKIMKKFLLIAKECKELKNFNSLFAIISGLGHGCILRLRRTNEKLDSAYKNMFDEMNAIFNPSKNMSNYRTMLSGTLAPAIPLFPQVKKDFYFIKENPTYVKEPNSFNQDEEDISHFITRNRDDNKYDVTTSEPYSVLVNFDKMRLVANQVRQVTRYSSAPCLEYFLNDSRDHKKMHEEWLMRKRIQEYINKRLNCDTSAMRKDTLSINNNYKSHSQDCVDSTSTIDRNSSNRGPPSDAGLYSIMYDERELFELSIKIEPDASSHNNDKQDKGRPDRAGMPPPVSSAPSMNSVNTATSSDNGQPSPTLSKSSSLSSCSSFNSPSAQLRPHHHFHIPSYAYPARSGQINAGMLKFGADSPDKVRKLQSLSEEGVRMKSSNLNSGSVLNPLKQTNDGNGGTQRHPGHVAPPQLSSTKLTRFISQDLTQQRRSSVDTSIVGATNLYKQNTLQHHHKAEPIKLEPPPLPKNKQSQIWSQQHKVHASPNTSPAPATQSHQPAPPLPPSISPIKPPIAPARSCSSSPNPNQPLLRRVIHTESSPPIQAMPTNLSSKPLPTIPQNVNRPPQQQQPQPQSKNLTRTNVSSSRHVKNSIESENLQNPTDNRGFCHPAQPQYYAAKAAKTKPTNQQPCSNLQCYHAAFQRRMDGTNGDSDSYSDEGDESNTNLTSVV